MRFQFLLSMLLLSVAGLATAEDSRSGEVESDGPGISSRQSASIQAKTTHHPSGRTGVWRAETETAVGSPAYHPAELSKPTPKPTRSSSLSHKITTRSTPTTTSIQSAFAGGQLNDAAPERIINSTISANSSSSTKSPLEEVPNASSDTAIQNATTASSAPITSSTPNVGAVQPTGALKAAGALVIGVAGIM
ncbi:hypothetical protein MMC31_005057, partial [Peltigera leucophlebia]|nr:hypothetical protein [Peltigera leucophlebia]